MNCDTLDCLLEKIEYTMNMDVSVISSQRSLQENNKKKRLNASGGHVVEM